MAENKVQKHEELLVALRKVIRAIDLRSKQLNKDIGLTGPQLMVLQEIGRTDGVIVRQIADGINLSSATVTSILDRLESRNLVVRERSTEDKRRVGVYLTEQGKEALSNAPLPLQEHFIRQFTSLEEWEQSQMIATMQRIANMMGAEDLDASPVLTVGTIVER